MKEYDKAREACSSLAKKLGIRLDEPEAMRDPRIVDLPDDPVRFATDMFELAVSASIERFEKKTGEAFAGEGWQVAIVEREFLFTCAGFVRPASISKALAAIPDEALEAIVAEIERQLGDSDPVSGVSLFPHCWRFTLHSEAGADLETDVRLAYLCQAMDEQEQNLKPYRKVFVSLMRRHDGNQATATASV